MKSKVCEGSVRWRGRCRRRWCTVHMAWPRHHS